MASGGGGIYGSGHSLTGGTNKNISAPLHRSRLHVLVNSIDVEKTL
jgi:hypothetical protein